MIATSDFIRCIIITMEIDSTRRFKADITSLNQIREFTEATFAQQCADEDALYDISLAVYEAAANIIEHGYQGQGGLIEVALEQHNHSLIVYLRDQAPVFNPTKVAEPDLDLPLELRPIGGLGIFLIRQSVNEVRYRRLPEGGNELVLIKDFIS